MRQNPINAWRKQKDKYFFLGKKGKIISVSCVVQAPGDLARVSPYWVGVVEFEKDKKVVGQIVLGGREPKVGDRVIGVMRRMEPPTLSGIINYGVKFKIL